VRARACAFTRVLGSDDASENSGHAVRTKQRETGLAAAGTRGSGLGLIGGGYGNAQWLDEQFIAASDERVGIGFITWSLARSPELLKDALRRKPVAVMLSFGDPREFAAEIRASGAVLICQCQNLRHVRDAIEAKADIVVAQGSEAGGHGATRGTFTLVSEVADVLVRESPDTISHPGPQYARKRTRTRPR
jgi:nitronate monooxygenase